MDVPFLHPLQHQQKQSAKSADKLSESKGELSEEQRGFSTPQCACEAMRQMHFYTLSFNVHWSVASS